jgi:hypothetical protein
MIPSTHASSQEATRFLAGSLWLHHDACAWNPVEEVTTWAHAERFVDATVAMAMSRRVDCSLQVNLRFASLGTGLEPIAISYTLFAMGEGLLVSEDGRIMRSFGHAFSWACHLRMSDPQQSMAVRQTCRVLSEYVEVSDGNISPPPPLLIARDSDTTTLAAA